jgi:hypothetical protein
MTDTKQYEIPQELVDISLQANAAYALGQFYVKIPMGYNKAKKSFENQAKFNNEFWQKVYALYPDLKGKPLRLDAVAKTVYIDMSL